MTTPESVNTPAVDEMLLAAARALVGAGHAKFMDIDLVRIAYGRADQAPDSHEVVDSLVRLCETGKLVPFVDNIIMRALLRGPKRASSKGGLNTANQVLAVIGDGRRISDGDILTLVRARNVLVSFALPDPGESFS